MATTSMLAARALLQHSLPRAIPRARTTRCVPVTPVRFKSGPYGYTQTKALVFSKFGEPSDVLKLHTHSISPSIPEHAAVLRALAVPIHPADVNMIQGTYGAPPAFDAMIGTGQPAAIPGNEGCFEVVKVGSGVKTLKPGDWVLPGSTGMGTWRTHALIEHADASLIPVSDSDEARLTPLQAATVSVNPVSAACMLRDYVDLVELSVQAYRREGPKPDGGAWFIQNGANSAVGRAVVQLGRLAGLRSINVVRERDKPEATEALKRELTELGATVVVTEAEFLKSSFDRRLREEWTRGEDLMLGLNCIGGKSATQVARSLSKGGTMVTYGSMSRQPLVLPTNLLIFKDIRIRGFWQSEWANRDQASKRRILDEILGLMRAGMFRNAPVDEVRWDWDTPEDTLKEAVQGTLQGFRKGKSVFIFGDM